MIKDAFHPERWDYFYSLRKAREKEVEKRRLTLIFEDNRLAAIRGNIEPGDDDASASQTRTVIIDERPPQGGIIQRGWDKVTK
jgi:outer membrane protein assembly factor BamE